MPCLFSDVASCDGSTSEHVIQECLGGKQESKHVICASCNHFFGDQLDPGLCNYYSLIIDLLRPLMPKRFQSVTRYVNSVDENVQLIRKEGGIVTLRKIHRVHKDDGSLKELYSSGDINNAKLQKIAGANGMSASAKFSLVPLTELTPSAMTKHKVVFRPAEHRAASKSILEVIDLQSQNLGLPSPVRTQQACNARAYVRNGTYYEHFDWFSSPMYDLEDEFETIFRCKEDDFSNRVLFCNCSETNRCYAFFQVAQTMPLGICIGEAVENKSYSLLYESGILANSQTRSEKIDGVLVSYQQFKHAGFLLRTLGSREFAFSRMRLSFERQLGRATVLIDMRDDKNVLEVLRQNALIAVVNHGLSGDALVRAACEPLLQLRFRKYNIHAPYWDQLFQRADKASLDSAKLEASIKDDRTTGSQGELMLRYYRQLVRHLVNEFGYPKILVELPNK